MRCAREILKIAEGLDPASGATAVGSIVGARVGRKSLGKNFINSLNMERDVAFEKLKSGDLARQLKASGARLGKKVKMGDLGPLFKKLLTKAEEAKPGSWSEMKYLLEAQPGFYTPSTRKLYVSNATSMPVLLHELGHAKQHKAFGKAFKPALVTSNFARMLGPLAGLGMAVGGSKKTRKYAPYVAGGLALPSLAFEGGASWSALKNLRKIHGNWKAALSQAAPLFKAFGTYAAVPLGATAGALLINKIRSKEK